MNYYQIEIKRRILDYIDYLYLENKPMNLYLQYPENFMNLNVKNMVQLILVIHFNMIFIEPTSNSLYNILEFHTLGASGKSIQNWVI